ncbi:MAG TPA: hypoxanthine phosphoribosyltransferase, partial [Candidatus Atribacteria bacterium]|nr:hypoxanthine phosphoribosyltransferase [Candidatus Atribacteria bacterium]
LISGEDIQKRIKEMGDKITKDYAGKEILAICVLKGASIFMADLVRYIKVPLKFDFIAVSSYGDSTFSLGAVKILKDIDQDIAGKDVLLVEDIVDTGYTLNYLLRIFKARNPKSLKVCTLLSKPSRRKIDVTVDYCGFEVPDKFVVGYGLDFRGYYRNYPYIFTLKENVYRQEM